MAQFFEMMRERGGRDAQFALQVSGDETARIAGQQEADDAEPRFVAESGETVGEGRGVERDGRFHNSSIVEIVGVVKPLLTKRTQPPFMLSTT